MAKRKRYTGGDNTQKISKAEREAMSKKVLEETFSTESETEKESTVKTTKTTSESEKPKWKQNQKTLYVGIEAHRNAKRNAVLKGYDSMRQYIEHLIQQDTE